MRRNLHLEVFLKIIVEDMQKPMLLHSVAPSYEVVKRFNRNILTIALVVNVDTELAILAETLNLMLQKRVLLICGEEQAAREREAYLTRLFRLCETKKMLNVVMIFSDFSSTKTFHSYTIFPTFHSERKSYATADVVVFPRRMSDLHGYGIRTMPDQLFPYSYADNIDGRVKVAGLMPVILGTFAASINATLTYPMPVIVGETHQQAGFDEMIKRNELDIPAARMEIFDTFDEATQPYAIGDLCIITPTQRYHSFIKFSLIYMDPTYLMVELVCVMIIHTLLHFIRRLQFFRVGKVFHYNLLTSYTEPNYMSNHLAVVHTARLPRLISLRILTFLTLIWSLCILTQFTVNLNSFITKPVLVASPKTWQDFNENGYKILLSIPSYKYISTYCGELCEDMEDAVEYDTFEEMSPESLHPFAAALLVDTDAAISEHLNRICRSVASLKILSQ
ncbi:uncharacterized protein LOC101450251 [Ceratitis capitata]|uniref:uncharacterized protein LOC101450251 n=1 Tax=Ceratitis capitata TaxID=7213 RepID=UPI00032986CA|nr:uncharacterized protein LOC101450251 [Ceratitis capitata]